MLFRIYVSEKRFLVLTKIKWKNIVTRSLIRYLMRKKCKSIFMKIIEFIVAQDEIDFNDRKTFERKETTDLLLNKSAELKRYIDGQ